MLLPDNNSVFLFPLYTHLMLHLKAYNIHNISINNSPSVIRPSLSFCFSFISFTQAMPVAAMPLQRKKSLPDVAQPIQLTATAPLSREEVSILSSMRREEIRRQIDESERLRANPLLYLVSPQVKVSILRISTWPSKFVDVDNGINSRWSFVKENKREHETRHLAECYGLFRLESCVSARYAKI